MHRSRVRALLLVGLLLAVVAAPVIAVHLSGTAPTSGSVPLEANNGLELTLNGTTNVSFQDAFPDDSTVSLVTESGNLTASSSGPAAVTVHESDISGDWTNVTRINATQHPVTLDPGDKQPVVVGGDVETLNWTTADRTAADDGQVDFIYSGPDGTTSRVTVGGVEPNTQIAAVDASSNEILDIATSDGSGRITFNQLDNSEHSVTLQTSDNGPIFENASPDGPLDTEPTQISVDVSDPDFGSGDSVDVNITLDGSQIHSETITSNTTVTTAIPASGQTGGEHDWTVEATDQYGATNTEAYTYSVPDTMYIRNETNHSELITDPINSTVRFFGDDEIYERQTSDGTVNLTGLPVNQDFAVTVEPTSDYTARTIYIQSIYEQQDVYLLNSTAYATIDARFVLEDPTGQYSSDSVVFIQKPVNVSGTVQWQTIHADQFGVEGVTATLEEGQRYRIKIKNQENTSQVVGPYRADVSETVTVRPGAPTIQLADLESTWSGGAQLDNRTLEYRYSDPTQETEEVTVWIHERNNKSNTLQPNETYVNLGNFSAQTTLSEAESKKEWVVKMDVTRDGEEYTKRYIARNQADLVPSLNDSWRLLIAVMILFISAGAFSLLNSAVGGVVVSIEGAVLWYTGWLAGATSAAAVVIAMFIAIIVHIYKSTGP
jgi:hypothetical protein